MVRYAKYKVMKGRKRLFRDSFDTSWDAHEAIRDAKKGAAARGKPHTYDKAKVVMIRRHHRRG